MRRDVYTTQQTAKKYKAVQAVGITIMVVGAIIAIKSEGPMDDVALVLGAIGLGTAFTGGLLGWWHHG